MQLPRYSLAKLDGRLWMLRALILACAFWGNGALAQFSGAPPYIVPAAAFNLDGVEGANYEFSFDGGYLHQTGSAESCFQAPVHLPDRFRIGEVVLHGHDSSPGSFTVRLRKYAFPPPPDPNASFGIPGAVSAPEPMASVSTSGASGVLSPADDSIRDSRIDNWKYAYNLDLCMPGNSEAALRLHGVEIGACARSDIEIDQPKILEADTFIACDTVETTEAVQISDGRNVSFVAGNSVALSNGFEVHEDAVFSVGIDAGLLPPTGTSASQETGE